MSEETKHHTVLSKVTATSPPPCDSCDETSIAYCTECDELLCNMCLDAHQRLRSSRLHTSFTLTEARNMSQDTIIKMLPSSSSFLSCICQYHNNQKLDLYCQQCTIPVCVKCSGISHKDHPVHQVSQQIIQNKEGIQQNLIEFHLARKISKRS